MRAFITAAFIMATSLTAITPAVASQFTTITIGPNTVQVRCGGTLTLGLANEVCTIELSNGSQYECTDCEVEMRQDRNCRVQKVVKAANGCTEIKAGSRRPDIIIPGTPDQPY